jgi:hypothetical protein
MNILGGIIMEKTYETIGRIVVTVAVIIVVKAAVDYSIKSSIKKYLGSKKEA